jgi:hypothetical protein
MFDYFKQKKIKKQKKNEAIEIMKEFAEGRMSTSEFWNILKGNEIMREALRKNKFMYFFGAYFEENNADKIDISKLRVRMEIFWMVQHFFKTAKYKIFPYNVEEEAYLFWSDIQPEWLDIRDEDFLLRIVNSAPQDLSKEENKEWCKLKIIGLFKYDKKPPEWIQEPEWPIVNGEPLIFKNQIEDGSKASYYFYNPNTYETVEIIQYD